MTIIQPNKNNSRFYLLISILMSAVVLTAVSDIFIYTQSVSLRHDIESYEADLRDNEVANAELKNKIYQIIDAENLDSLQASNSLVLDKKPEYVKADNLISQN